MKGDCSSEGRRPFFENFRLGLAPILMSVIYLKKSFWLVAEIEIVLIFFSMGFGLVICRTCFRPPSSVSTGVVFSLTVCSRRTLAAMPCVL